MEYRNIYAPNSLVSIYPYKEKGKITNVTIDNVVCASCRIGTGTHNGENIKISNLKCKNIKLTEKTISLDNCIIDTSDKCVFEEGYTDAALVLAGGNYNINNLTIKGGNNIQKYAVFMIAGTEINFTNCTIEPKNFETVWYNSKKNYNVHFNNCDFGGARIPAVRGSANNCKATFIKSFKNFKVINPRK